MNRRLIIKAAYILVICLLVSSVGFTSSSGVYEGYFQGLFEVIDMMYYRELGLDNIKGMALNGAMENLNEYSCFVLNDSEVRVNSNTGVFLEKVRNGLRVVSVLPDSSASDTGIEAGDTIILVDKMSTAAMSEDAFNSYVIGNGSALVIYIDKDTGSSRSVVLESGTTAGRDVEFVQLDGAGYIRVNRFSQFATDRFRGILEAMKALGNTRIILDLRSLYTMNIADACNLAEFLVSGDTMARTKEKSYNATAKDVGFEVAILVDEMTTGAAEAIAMAIPGTIYGQSSNGYAVFVRKYPVFTERAYEHYSEVAGTFEVKSIVSYLKSHSIELWDHEVTGYINIVESGIFAGNMMLINDKNRVVPDVYVEDTDMGYLNYSPGAYMIDIERDYRMGGVNYDIFIAKKILGFLGYFDGTYNVVFDDEFEQSLNEYKRTMGFPVDGVLDMGTQSSLNTYSMKTAVSEDECVKEALSGFLN
ncbi:MAG TPA: S41 family peptidase [Clostridia bacterium]|nr:S41 family peptidase [Clostridia bacterium]HRX41253.1 S41 family peptidase [Clostridia bacterium]